MKHYVLLSFLVFIGTLQIACSFPSPSLQEKQIQDASTVDASPSSDFPKKEDKQADTPIPTTEEKPSGLRIGYVCEGGYECATRLCSVVPGMTNPICTQKCSAHADCPTGYLCESHSTTAGMCVPACKKDADCASFSKLPSCNIEGHCWKAWRPPGYPCETDAACQNGVCAKVGSLKKRICLRTCKEASDCGYGFACHQGTCRPTCSADSPCSEYKALSICSGQGLCE